MSIINLNTNTNTITELGSTAETEQTNTTALSAAEWRKLLMEELQKEEVQKKMPPPPPPSASEMTSLLETAVTKGVLTTEEATALTEIMTKRQSQHAAGANEDMQALFTILKEYMAEEETSTTDKTGDTKTYTVEELKAKMNADKAARLAKLKAAVDAAQVAGALTAAQLTEINTFISEEETLIAGMSKVDAAGLTA